MIDMQDLPARLLHTHDPGIIRQNKTSEAFIDRSAETAEHTDGGSFALASQERELVMRALAETHGNQSLAARHLGIGRDALRYKMKKHGLDQLSHANTLN